MQKGHKNFNIVGKTSCLGLVALGLALVNPVSSFAFAEEAPEEVDEAVTDGDIETYASTPSTVTISFSPSSASGSVTPIDSSVGDKAKVDVKATVRVQNSGGYSVYVGSSSSQLKNGSNVIDSVTAATTYANLPLNRWGYSFQEGSTVKDSYVAMPATLRSSALYSNTSTNIADETKTFMLSFAARISADKPSGMYSNSVTMSVVSSPLEVAVDDWGITNMQQMTSTICSNAKDTNGDGENTTQLKDTRDGKYYWVSKLGDGKCWMTQNLDLDLSKNTKLTLADSDVLADYTPDYDTANIADSSAIVSSNTGQMSWSLGNYRIVNPDTSSDCGSAKSSAADCMSQFTVYATPTSQNGDTNAHYILGNHYQWNAATAGTGGAITAGQAESSICSKGWRLPTSNSDGELAALVVALGVTSPKTDAITKLPFYGVRGGQVVQNANYLFNYAGRSGYYWSSTPIPDVSNRAYSFYFGSTSDVIPSYLNYSRSYGLSVRCVAK